MNIHYLDPNAWLKRYFAEAGTDRIAGLFRDAGRFACARFGLIEVVAAIARRGHGEGLAIDAIHRQIEAARADFHLFQCIEWTEPLAQLAESLATTHHLRAADAIHLASALSVGEYDKSIMVSADIELLNAARASGLAVMDFSTHKQ